MRTIRVGEGAKAILVPEEAFKVVHGLVVLNEPGGLTQKFVCPKCGIVGEVDLEVEKTYVQTHYKHFQFVDGKYKARGSSGIGSLNEADDDHLEAICCARCGETILYQGQKVEDLRVTAPEIKGTVSGGTE